MRHLLTLGLLFILAGAGAPVLSAQCTYELLLSDSESDGWDVPIGNGASVDIYINNVYERTETFNNGAFSSSTINVNDADLIRLEYIPASGGMQAVESNDNNCFQLIDPNGILVASKQGDPDTITVSTTVACGTPVGVCTYYAELFDTQAETWDGALLSVAAGTDTLEFTISDDNAFYALFPFYVSSGVSIRLEYTGANTTNANNAYRLLDEGQVPVYNSGYNPLPGMPLFRDEADCDAECMVVCPPDTVITLGPGACDTVYNYDISFTGPCEWPADTFNGFSGPFGPNAADVQENGGTISFSHAPDTMTLTSADGGQGNNIRTSVSWEIPKDGMLSFNWYYETEDFFPSEDYLLTVQTGQMGVVLIDTVDIFATVQSGSFVTPLSAGDTITIAMETTDALLGPATADIFDVSFVTEALGSTLEQIEGLASGDVFPIDTNRVTWQITSFSGSVSTCSFNVIVEENPESDDLFCNQGLNISLGTDCSATITPKEVLVINDSTGCLDDFIVYFEDEGINIGNTVNGNYVGDTLVVVLEDTTTGNSCWSTALIEDKIDPQIFCADDTIPCTDVGDLPLPIATDNCDQDPQIIVIDSIFSMMSCDTLYSGTITVRYAAEDASGNRSDTCTQVFTIERIDLDDVVFPNDLLDSEGTALSCDIVWYIINPDTVPNPDLSGYPMIGNMVLNDAGAMALCGLDVYFSDAEIPVPGNCIRKFKRTWTVEDATCDPPLIRVVGQQTIEVSDTVDPTITCPTDFTFGGVMENCEADVLLPAAQVSDNWSGIDRVDISLPVPPYQIFGENGGVTVTFPAGVFDITYTVFDNCGNQASCTYTITVEDNVQPVPVCKESLVVSLTEDGTATVPAETFDSGSRDECGVDSFAVARMFPGCNGDDDAFGPEIVFGCCDMADNPIMVILRVFDEAGNFNDCMIEAVVQDKINPTFQCPPPITISCEYPIDTGNLDIFGTLMVLDDPNDILNPATDPRSDIIIDDPGNPDSPTNFGKDGWVYDNCDLSFTSSFTLNLDQCNTGQLVRTFVISNGAGMVVGSCQQVITITNFTPFNPATDIVWPNDTVVYNVCSPDDLDPDIYGRPMITEDQCDRVAIGYDDCIFDILDSSETACFKVLRKWKVTDECQVDRDGNHLVVTRHQVIKFMNNIAPTIRGCDDVSVCSYDLECGPAFIPLTATATDDCTPQEELVWTYDIDAFNDDVFDFSPGNNPFADDPNNVQDASGSYPVGMHRIVWTVEDKCGNASRCTVFFEVKNCKTPTAICHHLSVNLGLMDLDGDGIEESPMVMIPVEDVDAGSNHPCYDDVTISFDPNDQVDMISFDCSFADSVVAVPLYVTDQNGNQDFCVATITVQDNGDICPDNDPLTGSISGAVYTEDGEMLSNADVMLMGSAADPDQTDDSGSYEFTDMALGNAYIVEPHKNDDVLNGVTTYDLALIQRHILDIEALPSPYKVIAADVDNSEAINVLDIVELRKVILGIQSEFNNNESWKFIDAAYQFTSDNPLAEPYATSYEIGNFNGDMPGINFIGVKIGDVSGDASVNNGASADTRDLGTRYKLRSDEISFSAGDIVNVTLSADDERSVIGFQFGLEFDPSKLEMTGWGGSSRIQYANVNANLAERGFLRASWNDSEYSVIPTGEVLMTFSFKAHGEGVLSDVMRLSSNGLRAEAYTNGERVGVELRFVELENTPFALYQNAPNPFGGRTVIEFDLPDAMQYTLDILNVDGSLVTSVRQQGDAGRNQWTVRAAEAGLMPGIYYYRLSAGDYAAVKKMVLLE